MATLAPELRTIAPVRSWQMGRDEEIAYAREHGIPVKGGTEAAPYSIDDNLWGRSSEGRWIEDLGHAPEDDAFQPVTRPEGARRARVLTVGFEAGLPVSLDGERLGLVEVLERAAEIGCRHGVGIVDDIEDRIVGLKVRDIYEVPAAAIVLTAHEELERLVGTIHQNQFKPALDQKWGYLVYGGLWWEPLRTDLDAYMETVNARVTGEIGLRLYKGSVRVVTRSSPNAVYDAEPGQLLASRAASSRRHASPGLHRALVAAVADGAPDPHERGEGERADVRPARQGSRSASPIGYLRRRYRREIRIGLGVAARRSSAVAAYLATPQRPRGLTAQGGLRHASSACGLIGVQRLRYGP